MNLYIKVSKDEYELPEMVAPTATELARLCGVHRNTIYESISRAKRTGKWCPYLKVEVEDEVKRMNKPTRAQKEVISGHKLNPKNWVVAFESKDTLEIVSRRTAQRRVLEKRKGK